MAQNLVDIDSTDDRAPIAQSGKAEQKRVDLLLTGLALVVTRGGGVPVLVFCVLNDPTLSDSTRARIQSP